MDVACQLPDEVVQVGKQLSVAEGNRRISVTRDFVTFDGRIFLRGVFQIPVRGFERPVKFSIGSWYEISNADARRVAAAWSDEAGWMALRIDGKMGNLIPEKPPETLGSKVVLGAHDANQRLGVVSAEHPGLAKLLSEGWSKQDYGRFAKLVGLL